MAGSPATTLSKAEARARAVAARDALPAATRATLSQRITARVLALSAWRDARHPLLYASFGSEFDTAALLEDALARGVRACLPRGERATRELTAHVVSDPVRDLTAGAWGIREPQAACARVALQDVDFVLVPGLAFTERCERLGYGGGYYDRLLPRLAPGTPTVAAAFALQLWETLPLDAHDARVDAVLTENGEYCGC